MLKFGAVYAPEKLKFAVKVHLNRQSNRDDREGPDGRRCSKLSLY